MVDPDPKVVFTGTLRESPLTDHPVVEIPDDTELERGESYTIAVYPADVDPTAGSSPDDRGGPAGSSGSEQTPPVQVGDLVDVTIENLGAEGDGIAKVAGGYTVFVPGGEIGDELTVEIETVKERYAFAEIRATARDSSD